MAFRDPIVQGEEMIISGMRSQDYVEGVSGWRLGADGSFQAESVNALGDVGSNSLISADGFQAGNGGILLSDGREVGAALTNLDPTSSTYPVAKGMVAYGRDPATVNPTITAYPYGTIAIRGHMEAGRSYKVCMRGRVNGIPSTDDLDIRMQYTTDNTIPTTGSVIICDSPITKSATGGWGFVHSSIIYEAATDLDMWVGAWIIRLTGAGALTATQLTANPNWWELWIEDVGLNSRASTPISAYASPSSPPVATKKTYTKTYQPLWSRTYDGNLGTTWDDSAYCYQGYYSSQRGNTRSLVGYDYTTIAADLAGATVNSVKLTFKVAHAYYNNGVTVEIGGHTYTAKPSTWNGANVAEQQANHTFSVPGSTYTVTLPAIFGTNLKSGAWKGIAFGPGPSTSLVYYGYVYGATQTGKPYLTINYTK